MAEPDAAAGAASADGPKPAQEKLILTRKGMKLTQGCTLRLAPVVKPAQ